MRAIPERFTTEYLGEVISGTVVPTQDGHAVEWDVLPDYFTKEIKEDAAEWLIRCSRFTVWEYI